MLIIIMTSTIMLSVVILNTAKYRYAECYFAKCCYYQYHYAKLHYADCCYAGCSYAERHSAVDLNNLQRLKILSSIREAGGCQHVRGRASGAICPSIVGGNNVNLA